MTWSSCHRSSVVGDHRPHVGCPPARRDTVAGTGINSRLPGLMPDKSSHAASAAGGWNWDHSYARLPDRLFSRVRPEPVSASRLVVFNQSLAESLGLNADLLNQPSAAALFTGQLLPDGAFPLAQAYAGHQFGRFTNLGDGRAILLGEHLSPRMQRVDIQLKGPGRTPYSRGGDGRAALGPMLREYLISEAMHALGIPTTRSLAVAATGEPVFRDEVLPGAVLTRVASSHLRVGTFQWVALQQDRDLLQAVADYTLQRHYPERVSEANPYAALLEGILERQAALIAQWQLVGFVHGVMNTDNMALSGETIDYGPCAFLDAFDPGTVFSSIDHMGRYAYGNQPDIALWNLSRLAETLLPLLHSDASRARDVAIDILQRFNGRYSHHWMAGMRAKLGLDTNDSGDEQLIDDLLEWMAANRADFTLTFRGLCDEHGTVASGCDSTFRSWHQRWRMRITAQPQPLEETLQQMQRRNPAVIPRNHRVEVALDSATSGDLTPIQHLLSAVSDPYRLIGSIQTTPSLYNRPLPTVRRTVRFAALRADSGSWIQIPIASTTSAAARSPVSTAPSR